MKRIVRLTESDLTRIVKRVINEKQYLMEGVPNTTLTSDAGITVASRTLCGGEDYIKVSYIVTNTGTEDAYLTQVPVLTNRGQAPIFSTPEYNVTIGGKPIWGQADNQNAPKIPKGKKATVNVILRTGLTSAFNQRKSYSQAGKRAEGDKVWNDATTALTTLKNATMRVRYNGANLDIPMTFGGFMVNPATACDASVALPKGF